MKVRFTAILFLFFSVNLVAQRTPSLGSAEAFDVNPTYLVRTTVLDATHVMAVYKSAASSLTAVGSDLYGIVGTVNSGTKTVSWGTRFTIEAEDQSRPFVIGVSATQAIVGYEYAPGNDVGVVRVITISGNSITNVGSRVNFSAGDYTTASGVHLGSGKIAISYDDIEIGNQGTVVVGDISGTTVNFGATKNYTSSSRVNTPDIAKVTSSRFVVAFEDDGTANDPGKVVIGDVSGTTITYGTVSTFHSSGSTNAARETSVTVLNSTTIAVAFSNDASADEGSAIVGAISGSSVSFGGSIVEFDNAFTIRDIDIAATTGDEFMVIYNGSSTSNPSKIIVGERSGNAISFGTALQYLTGLGDDNRLAIVDENTFVLCYTDDLGTPTDQGESQVGTLPSAAPSSATIAATAFLEGAYNGANLNTTINSSIPTAQPYSGVTYNSHSGTESASAPAGAVDWILVELREAGSAATALNSTKVGSTAGFLMSDGSIKATDGTSNLTVALSGNTGADFFVVIYHRNHLPIMSASAISVSSSIYTIDFTSASANTYQTTTALASLSGGKFGLPAGDTDGDGDIDATDLTTWRTNNGAAFSYSSNGVTDFNLDGVINAIDRNGFHQKNTAKTRQVPST